MQNKLWSILILATLLPLTAHAAREAKARPDAAPGESEPQRLVEKGQELLQLKDTERGVKMLETVLEQYPKSRARFGAQLALGRHYVAAMDLPKAIGYLANIRAMEQPDTELNPADRETYLEGLYLLGVAYFQGRQFSTAFPILRKITNDYPNSVWANQAYYYIGMCHFAQQNWGKAIEALSMVGTFVDADSPTIQFIEAGRRFFVKIQDADLPVLTALGKPVNVTIETARGDKETIECVPLTAGSDVYIGSLATAIGLAKPGDRVLQVIGGDSLTTRYTDTNDETGKLNVTREAQVKVVSTGVLNFTLGDYETRATAAFLDQPLFVVLQDADLDVSPAADTATLTILARYKDEDNVPDASTKGVDVEKLLAAGQQAYQTRDQVTLKLSELGTAPVHTGRFGGKLTIGPAETGKPADQGDQILTCALDDEIILTYTDDRHINGESPRTVEARLIVGGEIDNRPRASQDVVNDPVIKARKNLVEATAFLELARIFQSMGLMKGAKEKSVEGLDRVAFVIRSQRSVPVALQQDAFKLKWELHLAADDFAAAMATCNAFNRLFPDSPFADQALMGIGNIRLENKQYREAITVFSQVLQLPKSQAKAEAQFRIAEATEALAGTGRKDAAVQQYKICAERYPDSEFAGAALAKLVDYYIETKDFSQATSLLEQVFQDHPDAAFLDAMLLKWVLVAYRSGDVAKAYDKCAKLLMEYPESSYAEKAKQIMPQIEARLKK
ncbi:MAG: Outer membrane protein assembly factor BamD [Verrucomicrobiae bacterium]|nr:Outer membrane protein assembly factor BamD [Verrucomicrobiae bacterium]